LNGALHIGTFFRIPVKIHWTFSLLILYLVYTVLQEGVSLSQSLWFSAYVFSLFLCVVLHEYGHALSARKFGVETKDIILSPIGGVARLQKLPEKPKHELIVALAGPAVNVVIAIIVGLGLYLLYDFNFLDGGFDIMRIQGPTDFFTFLFILNIALFMFNLIPAFPMDGGRVLRALLAMKFGRVNATKVASIVGRILAVGFIIFGYLNQLYVLAFIGVFIFLTAAGEYRYAKLNRKLEEFDIKDLMRTSFTKVHIGDTFEGVLDLYKRGIETNFLVFDSIGYVVGAVPSQFLGDLIKNPREADLKINEFMSKSFAFMDVESSLQDLYNKMQQEGLSIIGIMEDDILVGVIDQRTMVQLINS